MKKAVSIIVILALCLSLLTCAFAAEESEINRMIKVRIVKTEIHADSVFNDEGYGSLKINEAYDDNWRLTKLPQAAVIDRNGNDIFPYKNTWHRYYVSDGIVSLVSGPYDKYNLSYYNEETESWVKAVPDPVGFFDLNGEILFDNDYWGATSIRDGYAFAFMYNQKDGAKSCLVDKTGQIVLDLQEGFRSDGGFGGNDSISRQSTLSMAGWFSEGLLPCYSYNSVRDLYSGNCESIFYLDTEGNTVLTLDPSETGTFWSFHEGLAGVQDKAIGKIGYIDKTRNLVIPYEYDSYGEFRDGLANVSKDGKYGYINADNETVIPFEYDAAFGAGGGLASVGKDGKYGLVDYNNNIVVPIEYDDISSFEGGVAYAVKDGYVYIITEDKEEGNTILGDADGDGEVTVTDATWIQRALSYMDVPETYNKTAADVDGDGGVTITDATWIQRWLARMDTPYTIGK